MRMLKVMVLVVVAALLSACATSTKETDADMTSYDKDTDYSVSNRTDGFYIAINYSRYQFIPESGAIATACKSALTAIAYEIGDKQDKKIATINEQRIRISMGRNGFTGITSCAASAVVEWQR